MISRIYMSQIFNFVAFGKNEILGYIILKFEIDIEIPLLTFSMFNKINILKLHKSYIIHTKTYLFQMQTQSQLGVIHSNISVL